MKPQFKCKDILKVTDKDNPHYGKIGVVTDHFEPNYRLPKYVLYFSDETTGTISEESLEVFNGKMMKPIIPKMPKAVSNTVWIEAKDGKFVIHCPGEIATMDKGDMQFQFPESVDMVAFSDYASNHNPK